MSLEPKTERGRRTRERIVATAAALFERQGVDGTGLDEVLADARASKSQLYHYFRDKEDLVRAVIVWQTARMVSNTVQRLAIVDSWQALDTWLDELVTYQQLHDCRVGCPIGNLATELSDRSEAARHDLEASFAQWGSAIRGVLDTLRDRGLLRSDADTAQLAIATLAAIQGGLVLTKTTRDPEPLRASLIAIRTYLRTFAPESALL